MEIELIGQSHKPALLQDVHVEQLRKQNLVIRPYVAYCMLVPNLFRDLQQYVLDIGLRKLIG